MRANLAAALGALAAAALASAAHAQEFGAPREAGPDGSVATMLDAALVPARPTLSLSASSERRFGLAALETRSLSGEAGVSWLRAAAGVSLTGERELGWGAAALALGAAKDGAGLAARALVRRDRVWDAALPPANGFVARWPGAGAELGGGAWVTAAPSLVIWASAPQVMTLGEAPPLTRGLEIGLRRDLEDGAISLWRRSGRGSRGASHGACFTFGGEGLRAWVRAEDAPLRGGVGLLARAGPLELSADIESHPELPSTVRAAASLARRAR